MKRAVRSVLPAALAVAIARCSGSSIAPPGGPTPPPNTGGTPPPPVTNFNVTVPLAGSSQPAGSAQAQSLSVTLVALNGVAISPPTTGVRARVGGPGCTPGATTESCLFGVPAELGVDQYVVAASASLDGSGTPLATGTVNVPTTSGGSVVGVVLGATTAVGTALTIGPTTLQRGAPAQLRLTVNELDPLGNYILGTFPEPLLVSTPTGVSNFTLSGGGQSGVTSLIATGSTAIIVSYDGGNAPTTSTFNATPIGNSALTGASTAITLGGAPGPGGPGPKPFPNVSTSTSSLAFSGPNQSQSLTVTQGSYTGPFLVTSDNPQVAGATISGSTVTVTTPSQATAQAGVAHIDILGEDGKSASVTVVVTIASIIIQ